MYQVDDYTVSLLHFDKDFTDETGKVWTAKNEAVVNTEKSKLGTASLYLNGTNQDLTTPSSTDFDFGSADFTIDWWEYRTANTAGGVFCRNTNTTNSAALSTPIMVGYNSSGTIKYYVSSSISSWTGLFGVSMGTVILNAWTHYALVRSGSTFYAFQNGVLKSKTESSIVIPSSPAAPSIGCFVTSNEVSGQFFQGYIDEFRISNIARWTENFDPTASVTAPTNLTATAGNSQVALSWITADGATSYIVKRSITSGGTYETIASGVTDTSYVDTSVTNGITYYYVVVAVNADRESNNSNEASATPVDSSKVLLVITMSEEVQKEYELSKIELNAFIDCYNTRAEGTGLAYYIFSKDFNLGPFDSRKDYIVFDKIENFEVMEFTK